MTTLLQPVLKKELPVPAQPVRDSTKMSDSDFVLWLLGYADAKPELFDEVVLAQLRKQVAGQVAKRFEDTGNLNVDWQRMQEVKKQYVGYAGITAPFPVPQPQTTAGGVRWNDNITGTVAYIPSGTSVSDNFGNTLEIKSVV